MRIDEATKEWLTMVGSLDAEERGRLLRYMRVVDALHRVTDLNAAFLAECDAGTMTPEREVFYLDAMEKSLTA